MSDWPAAFAIDALVRDTNHYLGRLPVCHLLLNRNATLPWFLLMPESDVDNVLDLPPDLAAEVLAECRHIADYVRAQMDAPWINFASIGNVVSQLHLHVVGRRPGDICWPDPVWGRLPSGPSWPAARIDAVRADLAASTRHPLR